MSGKRIVLGIFSVALFLASCTTAPLSATFGALSSPSGPRSIVLGSNTVSEADLGKFNSWRCKDYVYGTATLVEVGTFSNPVLEGVGFVLYDGSSSGELTNYQRKGLNHRWDWGPTGVDYAFIVKPDGTGLFYDFSLAQEGESIKANEVYKCSN